MSYETVRRRVLKFGPVLARRPRERRSRPSGRWHLDEMVVRIAGIRLSPQKQARSVKSGFGPPQPIQRRNLRGSGVSLCAQEDRAGTGLSDVSFGFQTIRMGL